ncbi:GumC family protein [Hymenobacter sp.]|jgi:capsular exopolysaccharide synthesis family protein|uniref:GumC family protein n=1 Tax=Hymenobacter sp. TaxID=1898978 RepID=UPI002ED7E946
METHSTHSEEVNLHALFFRLRSYWLWFLLSLGFTMAVAWLYLQVKTPVYSFRSTMLLGDQNSGSKRIQELLQLLEVKQKSVQLEDEIGVMTSANMVRRTLVQLPFTTSFFSAPDNWLNTFGNVQVREQPADNMPFRVTLTPEKPQLTNVPIYVQVLPGGQYRVQAEAKLGELRNLTTGELAGQVPEVHLDQVVSSGQELRHPLLTAVFTPNPTYTGGSAARYSFRLHDVSGLVTNYQSRLKVRPLDRESRIIELSIQGPVPAKEIQFLNALMTTFVEDDLQQKNQIGSKTVAFLNAELGKLSAPRQQSAAALSSFRTSRGMVDVGVQSAVGIQQQGELEMTRARVATNRKYYASMLQDLQSNEANLTATAPSGAGIDDPALLALIQQLAALNSQRAAFGVSGSSINPQVMVLDQQISSTKQSLQQTLSNLNRAADISLRDLNEQLGSVRSRMNQMPENERRMARLETKKTFNEKHYNFLVEKRDEAAIALATNVTDKKIVDQATQVGVGPTSTKKPLVLLIALLAGIAVPAGVIVLRHKTSRLIQSQEDLARITAIPLLGVVAHGTSQEKRQMLHNPKGPITESFRSIRVNFQYLLAGLDKRVLGVASSVPGEGKTFCALNLAAEMAKGGQRVVLLECDLRRPTVADYFSLTIDPAHGLSTYLEGQSTLEQIRCASSIENLDLIPCGPVPSNPTQLLESPQLADLLRHLRHTYDYVLVDTPPVGYVAEFFVLQQHLDASIYIVRQNYTDRGLLRQVDELYRKRKIKDIFLVINDVHFNKTYEYRHKEKAYAYHN